MSRWSADIINPRPDLDATVISRGGRLVDYWADVLVVGLPGDESDEADTQREIDNSIGDYHPRLIIWENVRGLASLRNERVLQRMIDGLNVHGYLVGHRTLNGARLSRTAEPSKRLWLVATDQRIDLPDPPKFPRQRVHEHPPGTNPALWAILKENGF